MFLSLFGGSYPLALAPMAGFTDRAMRLLAKEYGADYTVTEMVSAKAVVYGDKKTYRLARIGEDEGLVGLQIFGSEPEIMAEGAGKLVEHAPSVDPVTGLRYVRPAVLDINMGCPVPKVFGNGEGSALMAHPDLILKITSEVKKAVAPYGIPVSVKMRSGITPETRNAVECAIAAEEGGADFLTLHPRTRTELYSGKADRDFAAAFLKAVNLPTFFSGDIVSADSALDAKNRTGADGLMIGRGAVGNPFLFREIRAALCGECFTPPTYDERAEAAKRQLRLAIEDKGEYVAVNEARKQIALYFKDFRGSASMRAEIHGANTYADVERILEERKGSAFS